MDLTITSKKIRGITSSHNGKRDIGQVLIFLILNTLKITIFNMLIISSDTTQVFLYKVSITFLLEAIIYLILLGGRSRLPFAAFYIVQIGYIFVNLIYYMYFHSYLHVYQAFALSSESAGAASDLSIIINPSMLIVLLDLPFAICVILAYKRIATGIKRVGRFSRLSLIMACLLFIGAAEGWNYIHQYSILNIAKANNSTSESLVVQRYGTFANSLADMALNKNSNNFLNQLKYGQSLSGKGANKSKPNFVVIQVESMDSNAVNKQHNGQYVMPFMHSLSQQNVYYPYTMSYHEAGGTSDSEFSTMNSTEPLSDYPIIQLNDYNYPNSIVRQLANNSYNTVAFHGDTGGYYNRNTAYPKMGYQGFFDITKMGLSESGWGAPDSEVFNYAEKQLQNGKQPFFAYTITMSSHGPFTNVKGYYNNSNYDDIKNKTAKDYMNSMSYVDQSIESYVNYVRANFKNTYIFIWGDHTPDVSNNDYKQASYTDDDKYFEFVPMIIVTPDNKVYKEDKIAASFLDIAPTIANASGVPYCINSNGMDLINRTNSDGKIPYRGGTFDRSDLFSKASQVK